MGSKSDIMLQEMAEELFQMQTLGAAARSRSRARGATELTESEFLALELIVRHGSLTVGEIQRQIGVLPAQMSRIVRALEGRPDGALIKCQINARDKRRVDVAITRAGQQMHRNYKQVRVSGMVRYLTNLKPGDCREFMRICRLIRSQIEVMLTEK